MTNTNEPINAVTADNLASQNGTKKPLMDTIGDTVSSGSKFVSFVGTFTTTITFILEKLNLTSLIDEPNFLVIPVITIVCSIIYFLVPNSINYLRQSVEKRLKNKKTGNAHELNELQSISLIANNTADTITNGVMTARSVVIKPVSLTVQQTAIYQPKTPSETEEGGSIINVIADNGRFVDTDGNVYIRQ